jgi:hypothetical protein
MRTAVLILILIRLIIDDSFYIQYILNTVLTTQKLFQYYFKKEISFLSHMKHIKNIIFKLKVFSFNRIITCYLICIKFITIY